ncbi:hypothetical protein HY085_03020, partial [Candidatus Gottesmanbacteria bacterium]|nr:hypothetical protein [Candidatus Gottesmanbacteria bacterium]
MRSVLLFLFILLIIINLLSKNQVINKRGVVNFYQNGCPIDDYQPWISGKAIECKSSLTRKFIGKLVYNGLETPEKYYELFVISPEKKEEKVYSGNYRTLGWEWTDTDQIKVSYDCGTSCLLSKIVYP